MFHFYLKDSQEKQVFSLEFDWKTSFISSHDRIWSRYSEMNKFRISIQRLIFPKITNKQNKKFLTQYIFFNRHHILLDFQWKQAIRKLSGMNFNYNYRLYLVLSKFPFTKIWSIQEYKQQESWSNKNYPHMFWIYWICSTPGIISNTAENIQILVTCSSFYIISNFYIIFDYKLLWLTS